MHRLKAAPIQFGPFELQRVVGSGGMAEVWQGRHLEQRVPVAVKVVTNRRARERSFVEVFQNEARAMASLDHPHVVILYDSGVISPEVEEASASRLVAGSPWLVMELVEGLTLTRHCGQLRWSVARQILLTLLSALAHAHARGVVHLDIKPGNVLVPSRGDLAAGLRLTDFGISRAFEQTSEVVGMPGFRGTPAYMAPEQLDGSWRDVGPWTDLYALGCLGWKLLTGTPPYQAESVEALIEVHRRGDHPPFRPTVPVPREVEGWLLCLLERDSGRRFQRAADASWALSRLPEEATSGSVRVFSLPPSRQEEPAASFTSMTSLATLTVQSVAAHRRETLGGSELGWTGFQLTAGSQLPEVPPFPEHWEIPGQQRRRPALRGVGLGLLQHRSLPLVDRRSERDQLWKVLYHTHLSGRARVMVIQGHAGCGKSRLADWLTERTHESGVGAVLRALHSAEGGPVDGLPAMLSRHLRVGGMTPEEVANRVEVLLTGWGIVEPRSVRTLAQWIAPASNSSDTPSGIVSAYRHAILEQLLAKMALRRTVVMWLDDIQWGGDALDFVKFILDRQAISPLPVFFIMTVQTEAVAVRPSEQMMLRALQHRPEVSTLDLGPLPWEAHRQLVGEYLGLAAPLADEVARRTAGNPMFALRLVEDWADRELLSLGVDGFSTRRDSPQEIPKDLHSLWEQRIHFLLQDRPPSFESTLMLAAVLGQTVDPGEWQAVCEQAGIAWPENLPDFALSHELMRHIRGFGQADHHRALCFVHGLLRACLLQRVRDQHQWENFHLACAAMLERRYPFRHPGIAERRANHLEMAGATRAAIHQLWRAAEERITRRELSAAEALLERWQRLLRQSDIEKDDRLWAEYHMANSDLAFGRRDLAASLSEAEWAGEWALRRGERVLQGQARVRIANIFELRGELARAHAEYLACLEMLRSHDLKMWQAACLRGLGSCVQHWGDLSGSVQFYEQALALYQEQVDPFGEADCLNYLGQLALRRLDLDKAQALMEAGLQVAERVDNVMLVGYGWNTLSQVAAARGDVELADELGLRALATFERLGDPYAQATIVETHAEQLRLRGRWKEAFAWFARAKGLQESVGAPIAMASLYNMALAAYQLGEMETATTLFQEGVDLHKLRGSTDLRGAFELALALVAASRARWDLTSHHLQLARDHLAEMASLDEDDLECARRILTITRAGGPPSCVQLIEELIISMEFLTSQQGGSDSSPA